MINHRWSIFSNSLCMICKWKIWDSLKSSINHPIFMENSTKMDDLGYPIYSKLTKEVVGYHDPINHS